MKSAQITFPEDSSADAIVEFTSDSGTASASLWWKDTPNYNGQHTGVIGDFSAPDATSAEIILKTATEHLRSQGCSIAIGPMNQNTWKTYRFVIDSDGRPPFLLEPTNPETYPDWWMESGFAELATYTSSTLPLDGSTTVSTALKSRILSSGISIENLDQTKFETELQHIYSLSLKAFAKNFLYTPLAEAPFSQAYKKISQHIDTDFVKLARRGTETVGFVFGIPDLQALSRGEKPALIVKTLAVDPAARCPGLGSLLVDELHITGKAKGYTTAIHALQHQSNSSLKITTRHQGTVFRRYALLAKPL
ncbi:GNAT family N-acetyltransferase [Luteolibacter sp. AS25]|uniref:GNAT family N-acetyltransferase n=1 Tax=Luteolibacter sp. AS25 TaxID=3135776 RepID=UPI00398BB25E